MATTRIMPLHTGKGRTESRAISDIIDYVANPQKTNHGRLITGYECDSRTADAEFLLAKRQYMRGHRAGAGKGRCDCLSRPSVLLPRRGHTRRRQTGWAWNLPSGLPRANTLSLSAPISTNPMSIITLFGVRSTWTVTENSATFGAAQRPSGRLSDTLCVENGLSIVENPKPHGKSYNKVAAIRPSPPTGRAAGCH